MEQMTHCEYQECLKLPLWTDIDHTFRFLALSNQRVITSEFRKSLHRNIGYYVSSTAFLGNDVIIERNEFACVVLDAGVQESSEKLLSLLLSECDAQLHPSSIHNLASLRSDLSDISKRAAELRDRFRKHGRNILGGAFPFRVHH